MSRTPGVGPSSARRVSATEGPHAPIHLTRVAATLAVLGASLVAGRLRAQVNIESLRPAGAQRPLSGSAAMDLSVRTGNTQLVQLTLGVRMDLARGPARTLLVGHGDIGLQGGSRFANAGLVHVRQSYAVVPAVVPEVYAQIDYDRQRLLSFRGLIGAGVRLGIHRVGPWQAWLGTGVMYEHERLDLPPNAAHPARTRVARWSSYGTLRGSPGERVRLAVTAYVQPRVSHPGDLRALGDIDLAVEVTTSLALSTTYHLRYDSGPPDGIRPLDSALRSGLRVGF